jgi:hypothetical protein
VTARTRTVRSLVKGSCSMVALLRAIAFGDVARTFHLLRHGLTDYGAILVVGRAPF